MTLAPQGDPRQLHASRIELARTDGDGRQAQIHTAMPGAIVAFNASAMTATVQLSIKGLQRMRDGTQKYISITPLVDVPVVYPGGGGHTLTFPIKAGDECLVMFSERSIDNWFQQGGVQQPNDLRMHDINDGFAMVGIRSQPHVLGSGGAAPVTSTDTVQLRTDDGKTVVQVDGANNAIILYANGAAGETLAFIDGKNGAVTLSAPTGITLTAPVVTVNGVLNVNGGTGEVGTFSGSLGVTGEVTAKYGTSGSVNLSTHKHPAVNAPPSPGT